MKLAPLLCLTLLMACQSQTKETDPYKPLYTPPSGGSAGQMGAGYCLSPPADKADRVQWNRLCFPVDG